MVSAPARFQLLVFDWDGTLADSIDIIVRSMKDAIQQLRLPQRRAREIKRIIGLGLHDGANQLFPGTSERLHLQLAGAYRDAYFRRSGQIALFAHTRQVIKNLHEQGYWLAIATGKSRRGLDQALTASDLQTFIHGSRCADETFSKPHPQMLLELMHEFAVEPEQTLMIGDSEHDLQMAQNAGVAAVAATFGAADPVHLLEFEPITSLDDIAMLPALLDSFEANTYTRSR